MSEKERVEIYTHDMWICLSCETENICLEYPPENPVVCANCEEKYCSSTEA